MMPLTVVLGWDSKEPLTWSVAAHSILTRASRPVPILPITRASLGKLYTRERGPKETTEFSLTRFLAPALCEFQGWSLFLDSDVLVQADIFDVLLYAMADPDKAVYVAQHDYIPKGLIKFGGQEQTKYPRKNWSSVMLFDNAQCGALSVEYVNQATGLELHRFHWLKDDQIGSLPLEWNWLVGEYEPNPSAKILHYTNGAPCFQDYEACDQADLWWAEYRMMLKPATAVQTALQFKPPDGLAGTGTRQCVTCERTMVSDAELWFTGRCRTCRGVKVGEAIPW